jgi:hypothetical protein
MRLSVTVNGVRRYTATVNGSGYLNAHVNLRDRPKENDRSQSIWVGGNETLEAETISFEWPRLDLKTGDVVEVTLLESGEGDAPSLTRRSSDSPKNLFSRPELARELVSSVRDFETRIMQLVDKSEETESDAEHARFTSAVSRVVMELGGSFLYPVYRRHPEFLPDDLKGELL